MAHGNIISLFLLSFRWIFRIKNKKRFFFFFMRFTSVLVIVGVYTALFVSIRRTRTATPLAPNEIEIAVRFFFIVFTDCLCWMPTIVLKIMALANVYIPADLYAWLVVFILPVNSAINPLLVSSFHPPHRAKTRRFSAIFFFFFPCMKYTFTTPTFRAAVRDFYHRFTVLRSDWTSAATSSIGLTTMGRGVRSSISFRNNDFNQSSAQANHQPSGAKNLIFYPTHFLFLKQFWHYCKQWRRKSVDRISIWYY